MNDRLRRYLDELFSPYEDLAQIRELKEELSHDLNEKLKDLKNEGHSEDEAFRRATDSIGDISELIETINADTRKLQQLTGMNFSAIPLRDSDFQSSDLSSGNFNYSDLKGSNFTYSNLTGCTFKASNLDQSIFDYANLTNVRMVASNLKDASFKHCILDGTDFSKSALSGLSFEGLTLNRVNFNYSALKKTSFRNAFLNQCSFKTNVSQTVFDGATMDKGTYAMLRGFKADLRHVTVK
ncbi:pentapeptide repeat-containing protein [Sporolactobacillus sp. THM7-7]|nr:pentapeptide repeat-containing protein [Sporolactobacillus sp. THM7-7]